MTPRLVTVHVHLPREKRGLPPFSIIPRRDKPEPGDTWKRDRVWQYRDRVYLTSARAKISHPTRSKVVEGGSRKVCAWIEGNLETFPESFSPASPHWDSERVTYNPFRSEYFHFASDGEAVHDFPQIIFAEGTCWVPRRGSSHLTQGV